MLRWLLRKTKSEPERPAAEEPRSSVRTSGAPAPAADDAWQRRLDAAHADDHALLEIARSAPRLEHKLAAVDALASEAALREAEREFRSHDRKVHQRARHKLAAAVAQRETNARAERVIAAAQGLLAQSPIPANRLAEIDREWGALPAEMLEAARRNAYAAHRERLDAALQEQDAAQRRAQWSVRTTPALAELERACDAGDGARLEACRRVLGACMDACPEAARDSELARAARATLDRARGELERAATRPASPPEPSAPPVAAESLPASTPTAAPATPPKAMPLDEVQALLRYAQTALDDGHSHELDRHLQAVDGLLAQHRNSQLPRRLRTELQAVRAERARLRGWQQWGGAVAREGLVDEAEALARATADAQAELPVGKLDLRRHGEDIRRLRARWKELDRTGAAAGQLLWQRFDAALTMAYGPVGAHLAATKAARAENLAAREALLATLDAASTAAATPRDALRALQEFQVAWRKLGPVEHTAPAASVASLRERAAAATSRIEAPLAEARVAAQREREALVERAEALAAQDARDAMAQLRDLQAEWQQHARSLPLARDVESALWARFRQAADAVAARREVAQQVRDAQAAAGVAAREALLLRLAVMGEDTAHGADELARAVAQVEREWRDLYTPLPRASADALESRYGAAISAARGAIDARRTAQWQAQCDAMRARLELCEQREAGADSGEDAALTRKWAETPPAPGVWQRALESRWSGAHAGSDVDAEALLLELEDALGVAPAAGQEQARRELKLRALKDALEGRAAGDASSTPRRHAERLTRLLARSDLTVVQRDRLRVLVDAIRSAPEAVDAS